MSRGGWSWKKPSSGGSPSSPATRWAAPPTWLPLGSGLVFRWDAEGCQDVALGVEICEDLWVAAPPSVDMALRGATVILNASASDEVIGKASYRRDLVRGQSGRLYCAYAYADAGEEIGRASCRERVCLYV